MQKPVTLVIGALCFIENCGQHNPNNKDESCHFHSIFLMMTSVTNTMTGICWYVAKNITKPSRTWCT